MDVLAPPVAGLPDYPSATVRADLGSTTTVSTPSMQVIYEDVWLCNSIAQIDKFPNKLTPINH